MSFFFLFSTFPILCYQKGFSSSLYVCVWVCVRVHTFVRFLCVIAQYSNPVVTLQAPAHTTSVTVSTTSPQFSPNKFHFWALKDRHFFFSHSCARLSLSLLRCSHHVTSVSLSFVSHPHTFFYHLYLAYHETPWAFEIIFILLSLSEVNTLYKSLIFLCGFHIYFVDERSNV